MGKVDVVKLYDNKKRVKSWDRCSTDRFIGVRCRRRPGVSIHHYERISDHLRKDILFQDLKEEQKDKYKRRLRTILNIPEPYESILRITSGQQRYELKETHWPVRARKHPFLSVPELVLDMPLFSADMSLNTLDWGKNGLASSLGDAIFIWNGSKEIQKITAFDETNREMFATALKWNKSGNHLAIGIERSCIQVWNATSLKKVQEMWCTCAASSGCVIAALEWHPRENILVSGCSKGIIEVCTVPGVLITVSFLNHMLPSINTMNFSCDGNRIAISSFNGRLKIARWPHDNDVLEIPNISTCRMQMLSGRLKYWYLLVLLRLSTNLTWKVLTVIVHTFCGVLMDMTLPLPALMRHCESGIFLVWKKGDAHSQLIRNYLKSLD
ncbi:anaphase-promoting complex subunit cdc20-like isoform X3 [Schistocerca gregaria]|uniref:anaphase-promoting complex subunit cdc20-like isoform X3 n=1 Tax=Schistocerca gregaria TaxID=7010 RepID=UPI00211DEBA5|nr:anaphase-promoting complex subunit cdc20-like isoform X3 [Schistocerca gregaria]